MHRQLQLTTATPMPPPAGPGFQTMFRLPESAAAAAAAQATVSTGAFTSILANAAISPTRHTLTLHDTDLLANDAPGPPSEATTQSLHVTQVIAGRDTHGTLARTPVGVITYVPEDGFTGDAEFDYQACDDGTTEGQPDPLCAEASVIVEVVPDQPPQISDQHASTAEDTPLSIHLTASDPEGDPITYRIDAPPASGTVTGDGPSYTYTPAPDFNGADSFTVVASDGQADSQPAEVGISVTPVNDPPHLTDDALTAQPGQPLSIPAAALLRNDAPGPANELAQTLDLSSVAAVADTHGTVVLNDAGTVVYTPDAGYSGPAGFTYTACDNGTTDGAADPRCATAEVNVTVQPEVPPVASPQTLNVKQGGSIPITLVGTGPDPAGLTYAVASTPADGKLTGTAPHLTYTPNANFVGTDSFTFTVSDESVLSSPASITVQVSSRTPPQTTPDGATVAPGSHVLVDVLANDTPGGAPLDPSALRVLNAPTRGTASVSDGEILYTPAAATNSGQDTFTYDACDANGDCATGTAVITITADLAPTTHADAYDVDMGKTFSDTAPGVLGNDPGADGQTHVELVNGVHAGQLLLQGDGSFTYTPDPSFTGVDSFTYVAVSPAGARSAPTVVSLTVTDDGLIGSDDDYTTQQDVPLVVAAPGVLANDSDTHSTTPDLSAEVVDQPNAGQLTLLRDGTVDYTPDPGFTGDDSFTYTTSTDGGTVSQPNQVVIHVVAPPAPVPTIGAVGPADGARVTSPVPVTATITPAAGDSIKQWSVTERDMDNGVPITIASGEGAPPSTLATFDPTLLRNGTYEVAIRTTSAKGAIASASHTYAVAGEMKLGDYTTTYDDLDALVGDIPFTVDRTYSTLDHRDGDFGRGWTVDFSSYRATPNGRLGQGGWKTSTSGGLFPAVDFSSNVPHFVTVTGPDGSEQVFDLAPTSSGPLLGLTTPGFVPQPNTGTTGTLQDADPPVLSASGGSLRGFLTGEIYDPQHFILTQRDGTVLYIDRDSGLQDFIDRNGNEYDITPQGVHAPDGPGGITILRNGAGHITAISGSATVHYGYSPAGDLTSVAYPNGTAQAFTYDGNHRLITSSAGGKVVRTLHYDSDGRVDAITDGGGSTVQITASLGSRQQIVADPNGTATTVTSYDQAGNPVQTAITSGGQSLVTSATYDGDGRQLSATDALGHTSHTTYDRSGDVLSATDALGNTTSYSYDALGDPLTMTAPDGQVTRRTYDASGNLLTDVQPDGTRTAYTYSGEGQLMSATDALGRMSTYTYNSQGELASVTDPLGHTTRLSADPANGRLASVTDPAGDTLRFTYDAVGNLTAVTDPDGHTSRSTYDAFDRVTSHSDADGGTTHYTYDSAGNLVSVKDPDGAVTDYGYDRDRNLTSTVIGGGDTDTLSRDGFGRVTTATNGHSVVKFGYDAAGDVVAETSTDSGTPLQPSTTFAYTYDADERELSMTGPGGLTTYSYDNGGRLAAVGGFGGGSFQFGYDSAGRLISESRPNGVDDSLTYNADGQETSVRSAKGANLIDESLYGLDADGNPVSLTTLHGTAEFGYDAAGRLIAATYPPGEGLPDETYTYDAAGNRNSAGTAQGSNAVYDNANRLLSDANAEYTYDANGNLTRQANRGNGAVTAYTWSATGQLTSVTDPTRGKTSVSYDPLGRLIELRGGVDTHFAYDGTGDAVTAQYDGSGDLTAAFVNLSPTAHLEMERGSKDYYYETDRLGSTTSLSDASGNVVDTDAYGAFGNESPTGTVPNPFTLTGEPADAAENLDLFPARPYAPALGRFLSPDPMPSANPYPYVGDAPLNNTDPTGADDLAEEGETQVYIARDELGCYVGITNNLPARVAAHAAVPRSVEAILATNLSRTFARVVETLLIQTLPGLSNQAFSINSADFATYQDQAVRYLEESEGLDELLTEMCVD